MFLLLLPSSSVPPEQAPIPSLSIIHCCHHLPPPTSLSCALFDCCVVVVVVNGDGGQERTPLSEERRGGHPLRGRLVPSRRRRPLPGPHLCLSCQCRRPLFLLARTEPPVPPGLSHRSSSAPPRRAAMAITAPPARPLTFDAAVSLLPPPSSPVVDCNVFSRYFSQQLSHRLRHRPPPDRNPSTRRAKGTCDCHSRRMCPDAHTRTPAEGCSEGCLR